MKTPIYILSLILAGAILQYFFPWWAMPLAAALLALAFRLPPGQAFLAGFLGASLLWGAYAFYLNALNDGILAARMGGLFGGLSAGLMAVLTAVFGGLFGALGAWVGSLAKQAFFSSEKFAAKA